MKRNKIFSADWHIRASKPQYRVDEYSTTILDKVQFIVDTANKYDADIIVAGDVFHNIKVGTRTVNRLIQILKKLKGKCYAVFGQHDLEGHNEDMTPTPYLTLMLSDVIVNLADYDIFDNICGVPWEGQLNIDSKKINDESILVIHHCVTPEKSPFFLEDSAMTAQEILDSCPEFKYIVSGDYHVPFVVKEGDRMVINCGCIGRSNKDQIDYEPRIYLLEQDKKKLSVIKIPIRPGDEVFHIPKDMSLDTHFSEHIEEILKSTNKDEKPDFITTVHVIMRDPEFTDRQRALADKYYNEVREA